MAEKVSKIYNTQSLAIAVIVLELLLWSITLSCYFFLKSYLPSLRFENFHLWNVLWAGPAFALIFILSVMWKNRALAKLADTSLIRKLAPDISYRKLGLKFVLLRLSIFFASVAIINPQVGTSIKEANYEGIDVVIALDISISMLAEDIQPNRLTRAKMAITQLVDKLRGDRIGLVVFAGDAFVQLPITSDYTAAKMFISLVEPELMPTQGTAIGKAIETALLSFDVESETNKAIIVITDGENHEDDAPGAARKAADKGVPVHVIGIGNPAGAPIPIYQGNRKVGFKKDRNNQTVLTKLDEQMCVEIADAGGGSYIKANNASVGLDYLLNEINKMDKTSFGVVSYTDYKDRYQWFVALAALFLILELLFMQKKSEWLRKLSPFS
ncbi:MAG: VWA domain-containing protein [Luteibaculaceae bacterium]